MLHALRKLRNWLGFALALAAVLAVVALFDWPQVVEYFRRIDVWVILPALILASLGIFLGAAIRWAALMPGRAGVRGFLYLYAYVALTVGVATVTPMQVGEALKLKFGDAALRTQAAHLVLEKLLDLAALLILLVAGLLVRPVGLNLAFSALATGLAGLVLFGRPARLLLPGRLAGYLPAGLPGRQVMLAVLGTLLKWGCTLWAWAALVGAARPVGLNDVETLLGSVGLAVVLSMIPGGAGVLELSTRGVLMALGWDGGTAEFAAVLLRCFTPVFTVLGLCHLAPLVWLWPDAPARTT